MSEHKRRLYLIVCPGADSRLVWAKSQAAALAHIVKPYVVKLATQQEIVDHLAAGIKQEEAA